MSSSDLPDLIDLTHPNELFIFGKEISQYLIYFIIFLLISGLILAVLNLSFVAFSKQSSPLLQVKIENWLTLYSQIWTHVKNLSLILLMVIMTYFFGTTLANRYHHWELKQIQSATKQVKGYRMEQASPRIRYSVPRKYKSQVYKDGKWHEVEKTRDIVYYLNLTGSKIGVNLEQITVKKKLKYKLDFEGEYQIINQLGRREKFVFDAPILKYYDLLNDFKIVQDGRHLKPNQSDKSLFDFWLDSGESANFKMTYQAQGNPRWVYTAYSSLLSNFELNIVANFSNAEYASGIQPEIMNKNHSQNQFVWKFKNNVSVSNPFGIFTAIHIVQKTGILPKLLLLCPFLLLWWLAMLYLSMPLKSESILSLSILFIATLMTLTYASRLTSPILVWTLLSAVILFLIGFVFKGNRIKLLTVTLLGFITPVGALLSEYSGLFLSLSIFASAIWLMMVKSSIVNELDRN